MRRYFRHGEDGFSLIELLTVVVIIGILAGIAIVSYLGQREKSWDAAAKSDLRAMQTAQLSLQAAFGEYTNELDLLVNEGFRETDPASYDHGVCLYNDGAQFVVAARNTASSSTWMFDSADGAVTEVDETDVTEALLAAAGGTCEGGPDTT